MLRLRPLTCVFILSLSIVSFTFAQQIDAEGEKWLKDNCDTPESSLNFMLMFNHAGLAVNELPEDNEENKLPDTKEGLEKLLQEEPTNGYASAALFRRRIAEGEEQPAFNDLGKSLNLILEAWGKDSSNYDLVKGTFPIYTAAGQEQQILSILYIFTSANPKHAESHAVAAIYTSMMGDFENSRTLIDKAYKLDPSLTDIYVGEIMYQMYSQLFSMNPDAEDISFTFSTELFDRAIKDHPDNDIIKLSKYSLLLCGCFFDAIFDQLEELKDDEEFEFKVSAKNKAIMADSKVYLTSLLDKRNPFLPKKLLLLINVLENNHEAAEKAFASAKEDPLADKDIYRLMVFDKMAQKKSKEAASILEESLKIEDNLADRVTIAKIYSQADDEEGVFRTLDGVTQTNNPIYLVARLGFSVRFGKWSDAKLYHASLSDQDLGDLQAGFNYYSALLDLYKGNKSEAKAKLQQIETGAFHEESAKEILAHFSL